jgi:long-chain fatty acid transport protein
MMISIRNLSVLMCLVLLAGNLFAGGFALTGVGSRATSMAGAFRGLSDDPSAMYWNPAGMGFMNENSVHLGGTFILPSATWDPNGSPMTSIPGFQNKEYEAEQSLRMFPTVIATKTKESPLKYGLGIYVPYGLGTTWDAYDLPAGLTYADGFPKDDMLSSIAVLDVHPTVAYKVSPIFSVGAGLSAMYGMIDINKMSFNPAFGASYMYLPITTELSGTGLGLGANFGMMLKPMDKLSIGLSGKLPATIAMEGDADINLWKPATVDTLGNITPASTVGGKSDIEADLKLPAEIGIGFAYQLKPNWTLSLDYSYTMWDRLDQVIIKLQDPHPLVPTGESALIFDWENTSRISLGTEYIMPCGNKFRGGFFFDETPIPEETQIPTLSDISNKMSFNLGWGRPFGAFEVELNGQYMMFTEREVEAADQTPNNVIGTYNSNSISGNIGLTYKF